MTLESFLAALKETPLDKRAAFVEKFNNLTALEASLANRNATLESELLAAREANRVLEAEAVRLREARLIVTEETLECTSDECEWVGREEDAIDDGNEEDSGFLCPSCRTQCAHFPLDELGKPVPLASGIAELREDRERLEWLILANSAVRLSGGFYWIQRATDSSWFPGNWPTPREAIDAARKALKAGERHG